MNEPGCRPTAQADAYSGLFLEQPVDRDDPNFHPPREDVYGRSSGVVGLRLFKNPAFDEAARKRWNIKRYFEDRSYYNDPNLMRPFENALGIKGTKLGFNKPEEQSPTSLQLPSVLPGNPDPKQNPRFVPRGLLDGADSIGAYGAFARVYLNLGTYSERWLQLHNPLIRFVQQQKVSDCDQNSVYWQVTKERTVYLEKFFLKSTPAMRLKDAPGGPEFLKKDADGKPAGVPWNPALAAGRRVFAQHCIACHSSKQPDFFGQVEAADLLNLLHKPDYPLYARYRAWAAAAVEEKAFWVGNYLSTDRRVPVRLIGTNAGRALASNGIEGNVWADFTSEDYKALPAVGQVTIFNPYKPHRRDEAFNDSFAPPGGGRGYYRPASLVSVRATAPYLHNNSLISEKAADTITEEHMLTGPVRADGWIGFLLTSFRKNLLPTFTVLLLALVPLALVAFLVQLVYDGGRNVLQGALATAVASAPCIVLRFARQLVNHSSLHGTYAARLGRAFLGASNPIRRDYDGTNRVTDVIRDDDEPWYDYRPHVFGGPYHLRDRDSLWWRDLLP